MPNAHQSLVIQVNIESGDISCFKNDYYYIMPAISFTLYRSTNFMDPSNAAFFANTALGVSLGNHCYQFEIRMPASALTTDHLYEQGGKYTLAIDLRPKWISRAWGAPVATPMDPNALAICSVTQHVPGDSYGVYMKRDVNLTRMRSVMSGDMSSVTTGDHYWGEYKVYTYNKIQGGTLEPGKFFDDSHDAIVLVDNSIEGMNSIANGIDWGVEDDGYLFFGDRGYGEEGKLKDIVGFAEEWYDVTRNPANHWHEYVISIPYVVETDYGFASVLERTGFRTNGEVFYDLETVEFNAIKGRHATYESVGYTRVYVQEYDETFDSLDGTVFSDYKFKKIFTWGALSVGTVIVTDGVSAYKAIRDGDYVRGCAYALEGVVGAYMEIKESKALMSLRPGQDLPKLYGAAAAIGVGAIEIFYDYWKYTQTSDEILKLHYTEDAVANYINMMIAIAPYGAVVQGAWTITIGFLSAVIPDSLASKICSSPGSAAVFYYEYWTRDDIVPAVICEDAYNFARSWLIDEAVRRNQHGDPTKVVLPDPY
ncbi:MAG: hypothetical protein A3K67_00400 [Euryarchaeota archaeon RBG_16_62_10]|nr:MAG: hypothetical protein A3K67_00400 [Euryarchaeota archaeon RBG_16_62_10]